MEAEIRELDRASREWLNVGRNVDVPGRSLGVLCRLNKQV